MKLYNISMWGYHNNFENANEHYTHVVVAHDIEEAINLSIELQSKKDEEQLDIRTKIESYSIDNDNSFEIEKAYDKEGNSYSISVTKKH
jgi:ABC-type nitrate/sulfonate/bicarbonate transport system ATPase subunit